MPSGATLPGTNPAAAPAAVPRAPGAAPAPAAGGVVTLPDGTQIITQADGSKMMRLLDGELVPYLDKAAVNAPTRANRDEPSVQIDPALLEQLQRRRMGNAP